MLITFKTRAYSDIITFGNVGLAFLEMMDFGKAIPGAIGAADVATALHNLEQKLEQIPQQVEPAGAEEAEDASTSLHTRAGPLIELLRAAIADESAVHWE